MQDIAIKVVERNVYFAYLENIFLAVLAAEDETIRKLAFCGAKNEPKCQIFS